MDQTLPLSAAHKQARMLWAETHILAPGKYHGNKFNLDEPNGYKYYWRDLRRPAQSYIRR
ncbi:hypothetical protein PF005_g17413 [Phytophthora fragariae]|uniref:Uncharacterized protein n=1 Tax=Phytophthora fragariae TaxID=53985 RepID=A0A6A3JJV2_9STRA|nr:hypothetical protein PF011_g16754 [Phytophthora fragariae]KAE9195114.1 hypothetical protein PF005_g17413 [Phytophthora fragariae]KAE9208155.1 hypothetical protein PF004_g16838 [Phytophthora fragariae]KAE9253240.1 hypothetical protein PF002_g3434 [Phytophthora fragariae]